MSFNAVKSIIIMAVMSLVMIMGQRGLFMCFCHDMPLLGTCCCVAEGHNHVACKDGCHHAKQKSVQESTHEDSCQHVWVDGYVFVSPGDIGSDGVGANFDVSFDAVFDHFASISLIPLCFYSELSVRPPPDDIRIRESYPGFFRPLLA